LNALNTLPAGPQLCHNDFHPDNILITADGPFIIDWLDATVGNPLADVARTSIILLGAAASTQVSRTVEKMFVRLFHSVYVRHYFRICPGSAVEYRRWLPIIAAARLSENIPEIESWLLATCAA
jgi:aminoglycoside/choline kinase family phosphotransferase